MDFATKVKVAFQNILRILVAVRTVRSTKNSKNSMKVMMAKPNQRPSTPPESEMYWNTWNMHNNMLLIVCACRPTDMRRSIGAQTFFELAHEMWIIYSAVHVELVAWHSGRTSVFDWRTFPVLRSTCRPSWWVTTDVGKPSATGQPIRPTQPFILSGSINE